MFLHKDLVEKIKTLRELQGVGAPRPEWLKQNREILLMQIKNTMGRHARVHSAFSFAKIWQLLDVLLPARAVYYFIRPLFIGCLVIVMVFGSWVTGVSASYNSLPGDVLYPVKIATEAVQTTLAPNKPEEIKLRVEFANRRAEEVKTITNSAVGDKDKKVTIAIQHLKSNLETVKNNLEELKTAAPASQMVDVVKNISTQTEVIEKKLGQTQDAAITVLSDSTKEQVKLAAAAAGEASVKAVEVIVQKHEQDKTVIAPAEVAEAVDSKLKTAEEKVIKAQEKIDNLAAATTSTAASTLNSKVEVKEAQEAVAAIVEPIKRSTEAAKAVLIQAKELLAQENFGSALDKLKESQDLVQKVEAKVESSILLTAGSASSTLSSLKTADGQSASLSQAVAEGVSTSSVSSAATISTVKTGSSSTASSTAGSFVNSKESQ